MTHSAKLSFKPLIVSEIHPHQAFPKLTVVWNAEMK
jgi:hypothetical protein